MKVGECITTGTILVTTKSQSTTCGIRYLKKGSIVKCAKDTYDYSEGVRVYRNVKEENENNCHVIGISKVRLAKEYEIEMWNKEIYFIESVNTI